MRKLQGTGRDQAGDEFFAGGAGAVRRLRGAPLQSANSRNSLQREVDRRRDGDDDRGGRGIFRGASENCAPAFVAGRDRARLSQTRAAESHLERWRSAAFGPEAGADGGKIVAVGTPEQVSKSKTSRTAPFLRKTLAQSAADRRN